MGEKAFGLGASFDEEERFYGNVALLVDSIDSINRLDKSDFLKGVFDAAFTLIPEAQKGSFYELRGDHYIPVLSRGYDFSLLSRLDFSKEEIFIGFACEEPGPAEALEVRITRRDSEKFNPETIAVFKALGTYENFTSLFAPINVEGENVGMICLENFARTGYSKTSRKILFFYARLISAFYTRLLREEEKRRLLDEKIVSLRSLAAGLSHELNSPLGALQSAIASLGRGFDGLVPLLGKTGGALSDEESSLFERITSIPSFCDARTGPSRREIRRFADELDRRGVSRPAELAEILAEIPGGGIDFPRLPSELDAIRGSDRAAGFVDILVELHGIVRMLAIASEATGKISAIVRSIHSYTAIDATGPARPVDIPRQLDAVLAAAQRDDVRRSAAQKAGRGLVTVRDYEPVPLVAGDADRLARVWTELLSNAMDAMKDGGRITIMLRSLGDRVRASFADSGPGIGEAIRARVFDPFFTTKDPGSGMGLGLPIAKTIVESLSGSIGFESGPSGSVFHVELPAWNPAVESATEAGIGRSNGAAGEGD